MSKTSRRGARSSRVWSWGYPAVLRVMREGPPIGAGGSATVQLSRGLPARLRQVLLGSKLGRSGLP